LPIDAAITARQRWDAFGASEDVAAVIAAPPAEAIKRATLWRVFLSYASRLDRAANPAEYRARAAASHRCSQREHNRRSCAHSSIWFVNFAKKLHAQMPNGVSERRIVE
jgi:hypothetical protein